MISVIIATKNGAVLLPRAVKSIQDQTFKDIEVIIVSDGSTDDTVNVARSLAEKDPHISVIELTENIGPGRARNLAIEKSRGEYVAFLDDDDSWLSPEKLQKQKAYLDEFPNVVAVGAACVEFFREDSKTGEGKHMRWLNQETDPAKIHSNMLSYNPLITSSVMMRKDIFNKVRGFKPMYLAEDYDLWLRMGRLGDIGNIEGAETRYVVRDGGASESRKLEMAFTVLRLAKEYHSYYPHYLKALAKGYARIVLVFIKKIL